MDHSTGNIYFTGVSFWADMFFDSLIGVLNYQHNLFSIVVVEGHEPRDIVIDSAEGFVLSK